MYNLTRTKIQAIFNVPQLTIRNQYCIFLQDALKLRFQTGLWKIGQELKIKTY